MKDQPMSSKINKKVKIQLTKEGYQELRDELDELVNIKLPAVIQRISKARDKGDLSENSEYQNAKEDKDIIDARISEIEDVLKRAEVISKTRSKIKIGLGSEVIFYPKGKKSEGMKITLVGEFEGSADEGRISVVSPVGKALLGKKQGDEIVVQAPIGASTYVIKMVN
jgi:transcription elongation factor GreA